MLILYMVNVFAANNISNYTKIIYLQLGLPTFAIVRSKPSTVCVVQNSWPAGSSRPSFSAVAAAMPVWDGSIYVLQTNIEIVT